MTVYKVILDESTVIESFSSVILETPREFREPPCRPTAWFKQGRNQLQSPVLVVEATRGKPK